MITVTAFVSFPRFTIQNLYNSRAQLDPFGDDATFVVLNGDMVVLPNSPSDLLMVARKQRAEGIFTWIGLYRHPQQIHCDRSGGYFGAGLWLLNSEINGDMVYGLLNRMSDKLYAYILANDDKRWALGNVCLDDLCVSQDDINNTSKTEKIISGHNGLGWNRSGISCYVDFHRLLKPGDLITYAQTASSLQPYNRMLASESSLISEAVRKCGYAEILSVVRDVTAPTPPSATKEFYQNSPQSEQDYGTAQISPSAGKTQLAEALIGQINSVATRLKCDIDKVREDIDNDIINRIKLNSQSMATQSQVNSSQIKRANRLLALNAVICLSLLIGTCVDVWASNERSVELTRQLSILASDEKSRDEALSRNYKEVLDEVTLINLTFDSMRAAKDRPKSVEDSSTKPVPATPPKPVPATPPKPVPATPPKPVQATPPKPVQTTPQKPDPQKPTRTVPSASTNQPVGLPVNQ